MAADALTARRLNRRRLRADRPSAVGFLCCGLACAAGFVPARGAPAEKSAVDQVQIDAAIGRGAKLLLSEAARLPSQGDWPAGQAASDYYQDELILLSLIHAGADPADPVFKTLVERALNEPLTRTYRVSLTAMAMQALGGEDRLARIADCARFLVDNQCENGQWSYGEPIRPPKAVGTSGAKPPAVIAGDSGAAQEQGRSPSAGQAVQGKGAATKARGRVTVSQRRKGPPTGDNSNSQYAALGLRACLEAGVDLPLDVLTRARDWWEKSQNPDGGWCYGGAGGASTGSMTAGAVGSLALVKFFLREQTKNDPRIAAGARWLAQGFTVKENPKDDPREWDRHHYYLYALGRAGTLVGLEQIGSHDWYAEGARYLLATQRPNGGWHGEKPPHHEVLDTCYAILFLRRATKPLPKVLTR